MNSFAFNINAKPFIIATNIVVKKKLEEIYLNKKTGQQIHLMHTTKNIPKYLKNY